MATWKLDVTSALLPLAVLAVVQSSPAHGYEVRKKLTESRFGDYKGGTIYPLLKRLEEADLLVSEWSIPKQGAAKKVYRISSSGKRTLAEGMATAKQALKTIEEL